MRQLLPPAAGGSALPPRPGRPPRTSWGTLRAPDVILTLNRGCAGVGGGEEQARPLVICRRVLRKRFQQRRRQLPKLRWEPARWVQRNWGCGLDLSRAVRGQKSERAGLEPAGPALHSDDSESSALPPVCFFSFHSFRRFLLSIFCMEKETNLSVITRELFVDWGKRRSFL